MNISFIALFNLIGIIHGFVLSFIVLYSKFFRNTTNFYLGITLLFISIAGMNNWFWDLGENPFLIAVLDIFLWQFLYPVTLFIYLLKATKNEALVKKAHYFFIPFIILSLLNLSIVLQNIYGIYKFSFLTKDIIANFYKLIYLLSAVFPILILGLSIKYVFYKNKANDTLWVKSIWVVMLVLTLFGSIIELIRWLTDTRMPLTYLWVLVTFFTYWLVFKGFYKFKLTNELYEIKIQTIASKKSKKKYTHTKHSNNYIDNLYKLISEQKIHQDSNINRDIVAEKLGISSGYLSNLIRQTPYLNFSDFINHYRIEDAKHMILNPDFEKYSLLAIGLEAGFKSKTTYYNAFKKELKMTPNQFKEAHQ